MKNKTVLKQANQDSIWKHFQNNATYTFDLSYTRLLFLAKRCQAGTRVLNIGVGSGSLEKILVNRGVETFSLDPCEKSITRLQDELSVGTQAKKGYSQAIPFETGFFDKVIMTEVIEHLQEGDLHATLDEVRRVLKPKGEFIGTVPYRENLQDNEVFCPHCHAQFHRWGHHQSFDVESLGTLFEQHGFSVKQLYPRCFPDFFRPGLKNFLKAVGRYVLGRMGEPIIGPILYFDVISVQK